MELKFFLERGWFGHLRWSVVAYKMCSVGKTFKARDFRTVVYRTANFVTICPNNLEEQKDI